MQSVSVSFESSLVPVTCSRRKISSNCCSNYRNAPSFIIQTTGIKIAPKASWRSRRRVRARSRKSEFHHAFDVWNTGLNSRIFFRKIRRCGSCSNLRNILTKLRSGNLNTETANLIRSRYIGLQSVKDQYELMIERNSGSSLNLEMTPITAKKNKAVEHANLSSIGSVGRESTIPVVRFIQKIQQTSQSGTPLSRQFVKKAYTVLFNQIAFVETIYTFAAGCHINLGTISASIWGRKTCMDGAEKGKLHPRNFFSICFRSGYQFFCSYS